HRVKNNLQTVAALLRLQSRRVANAEARTALEEAMRRVSSIALVHETLSSAIDEEVAFDDVVDRLLAMLGEVTGSTGRVQLQRCGTFGELPAELATPLVMVLTELVGNAIEHGFAGTDAGSVVVSGARARGGLRVAVTDDGAGLPAKFSLDGSDRLGLQIVRTLVDAELGASLSIGGNPDRGAAVRPGNEPAQPGTNPARSGTEVSLQIPLDRPSS
ncbi:MAG: sensor histidine kinase, partial [Jatrophihabitans sp.]